MPSHENEKQLRILLVDDDDQVREILTDMLGLDDHEVVPVNDPFEALRLLGESTYDLLVTDLGMPGMSGLELAVKARDINPNLPIALVTGWGSQLNEGEVLEKGIRAVLAKPFKLKDIRELITRLTSDPSLSAS